MYMDNYMKKEDTLLLEELLIIHIDGYIHFLVYFTRFTLHGSREWLQSTENLEEEYYSQLIYY